MSFRTDDKGHPDIYFYPDFASLKSDFEHLLKEVKAKRVQELKESDLADLKNKQKDFAYLMEGPERLAVLVSIHKTQCVCERQP